jgi:ABC-type transport system involved in multi-copper enzyme maturation permease subunit
MAFRGYFTFPLVNRELRSQSRYKGSYGLRATVVLLLSLPLLFLVIVETFEKGAMRQVPGQVFFGILASLIFYGLMLLGPLVSAGSITVERESGTLGLLFLSPLRSLDIVFGKFSSNFLRLFAVAIAGMPVLAVTLLMGGVTWLQVTGAGISIVSLLILTVAASIFASTFCQKTQTATVLAFVYVLGMNFGVWWFFYFLKSEYSFELPEWILLLSPSDAMSEQFSWSKTNYIEWACKTFGVACLHAMILLGVSARRLPLTLAPSATPVRRSFLSRVKGRAWGRDLWTKFFRNKNMLLWLEYRKFGVLHATMFLVVLFFVAWFLWDHWGLNYGYEIAMGWGVFARILLDVIILGVIVREVVEDRRDRKFELLLCTPIDPSSLIRSRFKGVWLRYGWTYFLCGLPSFLLVSGKLGDDIWSFLIGAKLFNELLNGEWYFFIEYLEDFTFFYMLFALAFSTALFAKNATNAILKVFIRIILGYSLWGLSLWGGTFFFMYSARSSGPSSEGYILAGFLMLKISMELIVGILLMRKCRRVLRDQCSMPVEGQ